ncbi:MULTISPECIES: GTPase domain-containing protein [unclassified Leptolyngbya]|uniref:GTPase domain-containing protein n=1 Tax=unclassified Leptolyngbya TaxID=2650499 RepID=UPI003D31C8FF
MEKTAQIAAIIEKRSPLAQRIGAVEHHLKTFSEVLQSLQNQCSELAQKVDDPEVYGRLSEVNTAPIQLHITAEIQALSKLRLRFSRQTLNIGVIGRARQGKSRLLQSLSGLTTDEIPDGDRQHCTGVRSTIHHNPVLETYGEVWFHSEESFLNGVIAPYYEKLRLGSKPFSLNTFANGLLPELPRELSAYAEPGAMYEHLKRYHVHIESYRHLLNASPKQISRNEIREYVAQDTPDGQRIFFNYLAVQEVKITCKFPHEEVGKIALVDMPGLGDTGVGDESRLVQTLGQDVDVVLFVRMPKSSGDYWADVDVRLYDIARDALTALPIEEWSFLVLNRTNPDSKNGDNQNNCKDLAESLGEKHIKVIQQMIANCADRTETSALLDSVLQYMAKNIARLDQQYAASCQERLFQLQKEIASELKKAQQAIDHANYKTNWFPLFETLFQQLWDQLTTGLEGLLKALKDQRDQPDLDFQQQVEVALVACRADTGLPTIEDIETRRNRIGGYPNAYYEYLNEVRAHLSQHFLVVDEALKQGLIRVKSQVADVLISQGQLGELTQFRSAEFLSAIADQIPEHLISGSSSQIKLGFEILASFDLSYRGLIQHRIRQHLDDLTPDTTQLQLSASPSAEEVLSCLSSLHAEAVYRCRTALDDLLAEPSQAAFAIVEEFVDRVLRSKNAQTEWRIFLEDVRSDVWSEQFQELGERSRTRRVWLETVERVATANQIEQFRFID